MSESQNPSNLHFICSNTRVMRAIATAVSRAGSAIKHADAVDEEMAVVNGGRTADMVMSGMLVEQGRTLADNALMNLEDIARRVQNDAEAQVYVNEMGLNAASAARVSPWDVIEGLVAFYDTSTGMAIDCLNKARLIADGRMTLSGTPLNRGELWDK
ncbi:MAG: hypothetical protein K2X70_11820 [Candidatus Obscuribacterales bacterium]|nr:hypothetical protein [Candidatus Obscuribacterales bacterium]